MTFSDNRFYVISSDKTILSYLHFLLAQNIDFSSIFTHVHIKSIAHIGLSDILLIFHICYWQIGGRPKIWERNQTTMEPISRVAPLDLFSANVPSRWAFQIDYVTFFLLDTSLHCIVPVCPSWNWKMQKLVQIRQSSLWARHPGNGKHFLFSTPWIWNFGHWRIHGKLTPLIIADHFVNNCSVNK